MSVFFCMSVSRDGGVGSGDSKALMSEKTTVKQRLNDWKQNCVWTLNQFLILKERKNKNKNICPFELPIEGFHNKILSVMFFVTLLL